MPALTNTKLPLCVKSLVPDSYMRFVLAFDVTFSPPKYNRMWFIIFKTYHPKVEGVRHIGDFVTFLIPVQTAFQGLSKWFYFTTLIVTTPYSGFNTGFSRLLLGYDKLSPICASILLICISFLSSSVIKCSALPVLAGSLHVFTGLFIQFCQLNP